MKRVIIFAAILFVLLPSILQAQEREPLAMRIAFEWTAGGGILGGFIGFAAWLTDPGNPNIRLSEQIARGAGSVYPVVEDDNMGGRTLALARASSVGRRCGQGSQQKNRHNC